MKSALFEQDDVQRWLRAFLVRHVGDPGPSGFSIGYPEAGNKTPIALVDDEAGHHVVVRLVHDVSRFLKIVAIQRRLVAWGLPVPRLLHASLGARLGPTKHAAILETQVPGTPWLDGTPEQRADALGPIAETLARFHAIDTSRGRSWWMTRHRRGAGAGTRAKQNLDQLAGHVEASLIDELRRGLRRAAAAARAVPARRLIHGRVNNNNFMVDGSTIHVVDLEAVCYGHVAQDLVPVVHRLARTGVQQQDLVVDAYEADAHVDIDALSATWPLYEARLMLARAVGRLRDHEKGRMGREESQEQIAASVAAARRSLGDDGFVPWRDGRYAEA